MTEQRTGQRLISRGAQFSAGPLTRAAAAILLLPLMTRVLASDALGLVSTAQVVTNILAAVAAFGLHSAAMREYFATSGTPGDPGLARALSVAAVVSTVLVALAVHLSGPSWVRIFDDIPYDTAMVLAVFTAIPLSLLAVGQNLLRAEDRPKPFTVAVLVATLGGQFLGLAYASIGDHSATQYLIGVAVGASAGGLIAGAYAGLRSRWLTRSELAAGMRLGLPTIPHSLGIFVLQMGDRLIIIRSEGLDAVGRYQVAYLIGSIGIPLIIAFNAAWTPLIFRIDTDGERWQTLAETTGMVHWLTGIASASVVLLAPAMLWVAAPASYDISSLVGVVSIIAPAAVFYATFQGSSMVLLQLRRTGRLGIVSLFAAIVNLGLNMLLIDRWGLSGAAVATTATYALWSLAVRFLANQLAPVRWDDRSLFGALATVGASLAVSSILGESAAEQVIRVVLATLLVVGGFFVVWRRRAI